MWSLSGRGGLLCSFSGRGGGCLEVLGGSGGEICTKKKDIDQDTTIYIYICRHSYLSFNRRTL